MSVATIEVTCQPCAVLPRFGAIPTTFGAVFIKFCAVTPVLYDFTKLSTNN